MICLNDRLVSYKALLFGAFFFLALKALIFRENHVRILRSENKCINSTNTSYSYCALIAACWNNPTFQRKTFASKFKYTINKQCSMHRDSYYNVINNTYNRQNILEDKSSNSGSFLFLSLHKDNNAWNRFVGENIHYTYSYTGKQESKISKSGNIYVFLATFIDIRQDGSIRITNYATNNVLISESFFYSSYSTKVGGSIYVKDGSCIQYRICSINSTSKSSGCHSYVGTTNESYIIESSLSKSTGNNACISLQSGSQLIDSTNISYAKCVYNAACVCSNKPSFHRINFTSIFNNTVDRQCVMYHPSKNQSVFHCNVIKNAHNRKIFNWGIVLNWACDHLQISFCVFSSNFGPSLFYNLQGEFVVDQCFLDNNKVDVNASGNEVSLNTIDKLDLRLPYMTTEFCEVKLFIIVKKTKIKNPYKNPKILSIRRR